MTQYCESEQHATDGDIGTSSYEQAVMNIKNNTLFPVLYFFLASYPTVIRSLKANSGHSLAWFALAKPCTIQAKYATAQNEITGLEAFTGTGYSNYLVSIPSIWLPGRFIALPFHRKRLPPAPCGTIISVDWMNEQKRCEPRESGKDDVKFPLLFPSRIYIMF